MKRLAIAALALVAVAAPAVTVTAWGCLLYTSPSPRD